MSELVDSYRRDGYVLLRGVFTTDELEPCCRDAERLRNDTQLMDERNLRASTRTSASQGKIVDRLDPVNDLSPALEQLARDDRIVAPVSEIFGEPALLMKDKLIFKSPGAGGYAPHQDYTAWVEMPAPPEAMISALIALDPSSAANGALEIYPGMHHRYYLDEEPPENILDPKHGLVPDDVLSGQQSEVLDLNPGDLVIFSSLAPHRSGPNGSRSFRRHIYYTYSSASYGDLRKIHYANLRRYLHRDREPELMDQQYFL